MGQRAVFGFQNGNKATLTTVQWSTLIPNTMTLILENTPRENQADVLTKIFSEVAKFDHISALELQKVSEVANLFNELEVGVKFTDDNIDYTVTIASGYVNDSVKKETKNSTKPISELVKNHPHAKDGFSMWFDTNTGELEVWISDTYLDKNGEFCGKKPVTFHV